MITNFKVKRNKNYFNHRKRNHKAIVYEFLKMYELDKLVEFIVFHSNVFGLVGAFFFVVRYSITVICNFSVHENDESDNKVNINTC